MLQGAFVGECEAGHRLSGPGEDKQLGHWGAPGRHPLGDTKAFPLCSPGSGAAGRVLVAVQLGEAVDDFGGCGEAARKIVLGEDQGAGFSDDLGFV